MYNVHYAYNLAVFDDSEVFSLGESFSLTPSLWGGSYIITNHIWTWPCDERVRDTVFFSEWKIGSDQEFIKTLCL